MRLRRFKRYENHCKRLNWCNFTCNLNLCIKIRNKYCFFVIPNELSLLYLIHWMRGSLCLLGWRVYFEFKLKLTLTNSVSFECFSAAVHKRTSNIWLWLFFCWVHFHICLLFLFLVWESQVNVNFSFHDKNFARWNQNNINLTTKYFIQK